MRTMSFEIFEPTGKSGTDYLFIKYGKINQAFVKINGKWSRVEYRAAQQDVTLDRKITPKPPAHVSP